MSSLVFTNNLSPAPAFFVPTENTSDTKFRSILTRSLDERPFNIYKMYNFIFHGQVESSIDAVPNWALGLSALILTLTITIGVLLNGATILIFIKYKKLRHLVYFMLVLDCVGHLLLVFTALPIQLIGVWNRLLFNMIKFGSSSNTSSMEPTLPRPGANMNMNTAAAPDHVNNGLCLLQQLTTNFVNMTGLLFVVTIAILRYRRLCWKKKDRLSIVNGLKWTLLVGSIAFGFTATQAWIYYNLNQSKAAPRQLEPDDATISEHLVSNSLEASFLQNLESTMYLIKIGLVSFLMATAVFCYFRISQRIWTKTTSHEQSMDLSRLKKSRAVHLCATIHSCIQLVLVLAIIIPYLYEETFVSKPNVNSAAAAAAPPSASASQKIKLAPSFDVPSTPFRFSQFEQEDLNNSSSMHSSSSASAAVDIGGQGYAQVADQQLFARLLAMTINYFLLVLGTPIAYIASCHRFRKQFARILCSYHIHFGDHYLFPSSTTGPRHRRTSTQLLHGLGHGRLRHDANGNYNSGPNQLTSNVGVGSQNALYMTGGECGGGGGGHYNANKYASCRNGKQSTVLYSSELISTTTASASQQVSPLFCFDAHSSSCSSRRSSSVKGRRRSSTVCLSAAAPKSGAGVGEFSATVLPPTEVFYNINCAAAGPALSRKIRRAKSLNLKDKPELSLCAQIVVPIFVGQEAPQVAGRNSGSPSSNSSSAGNSNSSLDPLICNHNNGDRSQFL